jgi:hypothetical protein
MEAVFLIILLVVLAGVVWWRLTAKKSAAAREAGGQAERTRADGGTRTDGALSGGSAAASAEAAGTSGIASAAGFGRPAEPAAPTTAEEPAETAARTHDVPAAGTQHSGAGSSPVGSAATAGSGEGAGNLAGAAPGEGVGGGQSAGLEERRIQDQAEWETQWSEASGSAPAHEGETLRQSAAHREARPQQEGEVGSTPVPPAKGGPGAVTSETGDAAAGAPQPVHHTEYTAPHAPTLPGAETAAVEETGDTGIAGAAPQPSSAETGRSGTGGAEAGNAAASPGAGIGLPGGAATETQDRTEASALVETGPDHTQDQPAAMPSAGTEPAGHLAAEEPYGMGSASAASDGSGPSDYTVKADAGAMVYYEEGHPEYEQTRADVWFESTAHAEAAGFRAPRRRRI